MTKKEQIEEMAEAVICSAIVSNAKIDDKVAIHLREFVENLYNAGYRKAEEVRKETAKEIIEKMLGYLGSNQKFIIADEKHSVWVDCEKLFAYLEKVGNEYGVEVEE